MHPRRISPINLAAAALAALVVFGLTGCNPAKGQIDVRATGYVAGSYRGPKVTCSSTTTYNTRAWSGKLGSKTITFEAEAAKRSGDLDKISIVSNGSVYAFIDDDIITVDSSKVWHIDHDVSSGATKTHVVAALACP